MGGSGHYEREPKTGGFGRYGHERVNRAGNKRNPFVRDNQIPERTTLMSVLTTKKKEKRFSFFFKLVVTNV